MNQHVINPKDWRNDGLVQEKEQHQKLGTCVCRLCSCGGAGEEEREIQIAVDGTVSGSGALASFQCAVSEEAGLRVSVSWGAGVDVDIAEGEYAKFDQSTVVQRVLSCPEGTYSRSCCL